MKIADLIPKTNEFFPECEYIALGDIIAKPLRIIDYVGFDNREGRPSVALKLKLDADGKTYRTVTHSQAILDILNTDEVRDMLALGEELEATLVQRKSQKTGRLYLTLE